MFSGLKPLTILFFYIVLHPCHKLSYFKTARWQEEWIETAEVLVRTEFNHSYLELEIIDDNTMDAGPTIDDSQTVRLF